MVKVGNCFPSFRGDTHGLRRMILTKVQLVNVPKIELKSTCPNL